MQLDQKTLNSYGHFAVHTAVDFMKLLIENNVTYECVKGSVWLTKDGKTVQAHCLDNRSDMFEIMLRNNFLRCRDIKFREVK